MFYILNYDKDNVVYNVFIRDYPLFDINICATPITVLDIKSKTYNLIDLFIIISFLY